MRALSACLLLLAPAACRRPSPPTPDNPPKTASHPDNGPRWSHVPARRWLEPRVRDVALREVREEYRRFVRRLAAALAAPLRRSELQPEGPRDQVLGQAWAAMLPEFNCGLDETEDSYAWSGGQGCPDPDDCEVEVDYCTTVP